MKLITIQQAAEYIQVNPITIRKWQAEGDLTTYRHGKRIVRVDQDELEALLAPKKPAVRRIAKKR